MAAIDKIYINGYENYTKFIKWCKEQPKLKLLMQKTIKKHGK